MTLTEARTALAAVLSTVEGLDVRARPIPQPLTGDGWVVITRLAPADFRSCAATLTAVIILGPDPARAEELLEVYAVPAVDAVTSSDLHAAEVSLEAQALIAGTPATPLYAFALTVTLPVGG